jgi:hypothetical protein
MTLTITQALNEARLTATQQSIDFGGANGTLSFYGGSKPADPTVSPGSAPLLTITLAKPCGTIGSDGKLALIQDNDDGDLVAVSGTATWARLANGNGVALADGTASDDSGSGDFKLAGTTGTVLYAGGTGLLGTTKLK